MTAPGKVDDEILHEGGRLATGKRRPMSVFGELGVVLTLSAVLWWPESTLSPGQHLAVWGGFMAFFFVVTATWGTDG